MKKRVKILIALFVIILIAAGVILFRRTISYEMCALRGGIPPNPGHEYDCDYPAKDAGKKCIYDSECSDNLCLYSTVYATPYPQDLSEKGGQCTKYTGDKNGVTYCHRKEKLTNLDRLLGGETDGAVYCETHVF